MNRFRQPMSDNPIPTRFFVPIICSSAAFAPSKHSVISTKIIKIFHPTTYLFSQSCVRFQANISLEVLSLHLCERVLVFMVFLNFFLFVFLIVISLLFGLRSPSFFHLCNRKRPRNLRNPVVVVWRQKLRCSLVARASDSQCRSRNCPGFDPSILRHSVI